jgi:tetratricopeptide (TPR) repeat protein
MRLLQGDFAGAEAIALDAGEEGPLALTAVCAALGAAYQNHGRRARELNERYSRTSPSRQGWYHYVLGEVDSREGQWDDAEAHYRAAMALAASCGATFLHGIAGLGLAAVQGTRGDSRPALIGYLEVLAYFERTDFWGFAAETLRNLADLFERLGRAPVAETVRASIEDPGSVIELAREVIRELLDDTADLSPPVSAPT